MLARETILQPIGCTPGALQAMAKPSFQEGSLAEGTNILKAATIRWDGLVRGGDNDEPIDTYLVDTSEGPLWFEAYYEFAENKYDLQVTVRNFGLRDKSAAGSAGSFLRRDFNKQEEKTARDQITSFFMGPPSNPALPFMPFGWGRSKCLGVNFPQGWITVR
jgi:hypothetical protein